MRALRLRVFEKYPSRLRYSSSVDIYVESERAVFIGALFGRGNAIQLAVQSERTVTAVRGREG